jgi:hypothetical protein
MLVNVWACRENRGRGFWVSVDKGVFVYYNISMSEQCTQSSNLYRFFSGEFTPPADVLVPLGGLALKQIMPQNPSRLPEQPKRVQYGFGVIPEVSSLADFGNFETTDVVEMAPDDSPGNAAVANDYNPAHGTELASLPDSGVSAAAPDDQGE